MMKRDLVIKNRLGLIIFSVLLMTFTSVTAYAIEERFVFSDLTATDKKTGLMWTRNANIAKESITWKGTFKFIEKLNKQKYAGHSDWRLQTKGEFKTLIDYAKGKKVDRELNRLFTKIGFRNVQEDISYWSSSTYADDPAFAWVVSMWSGNVYGYYKDYSYFVWPVRAGQ